MRTNFQLVGNKVAVKLDKAPEKSDGGIYYAPQTQNEQEREVSFGEVVAVGPGLFSERHWKDMPISVQVGQRVAIPRWGRNELEVDGEKLVVLLDTEVLAVLPPKSE